MSERLTINDAGRWGGYSAKGEVGSPSLILKEGLGRLGGP